MKRSLWIVLGVLAPAWWCAAAGAPETSERIAQLGRGGKVARAAETALPKRGADAVAPLRAALDSEDIEVRTGVLYVLGKLGNVARSAAGDIRKPLRDGPRRARIHGWRCPAGG